MRPPKRPTPLLGIVGPTGSGKTELALALAQRLPVEILVADSRQVYRGMDVGTATPNAEARTSVTHHLLDLVTPDRPFTVAEWVAQARDLVPQIAARSRLPLLVGGTGLYVTSLVDGYDYASQAWSPELRKRLAAELEAEGLAAMARRLQASDPDAAARTDLRNSRRVLRALERAEAESGGVRPRADPWPGRVALLGLSRPRPVLDRRIEERAAQMFRSGLLEEVRGLLAAGYGPELGPMTGHGYREAARHLAGEWSLDEAVAVTARRTRRYARRQLSWFRRDPRIVWLAAGDLPGDDRVLVDRALEVVNRLIG